MHFEEEIDRSSLLLTTCSAILCFLNNNFDSVYRDIKKRKIHVISTPKRPVPLVHHLYTGSVGQSQEDLFPIVDENGKFLERM